MAQILDQNLVGGVINTGNLGTDNLFGDIEKASAVLTMGRSIGTLSAEKNSIPIPKSMISVEFVNGHTGEKPVTDASLGVESLNVGKIAGIVLIPTDIIEDASLDLWNDWIRPKVPEAFGVAVDMAAVFGIGKPQEWVGFQSGLVPQAAEKKHTVELTADIYQNLLGKSGMIYQVNKDGFPVNGWIGDTEVEAELRGAVDKIGRPLLQPFMNPLTGTSDYSIYGNRYFSLENGAWNDTVYNSLLIGGDFSKLIYGIRKEITYRTSTDASVRLPNGQIVNCFQQNVVAFLMEMRIAAAVLNPTTKKNPDDATRFPFSVLVRTTGMQIGYLPIESSEGANAGDTYISVPKIPSAHKLVYKTGASAEHILYDAALSTGWTALPKTGVIGGLTDGTVITVAETDKNNKAKACGSAVVVTKPNSDAGSEPA